MADTADEVMASGEIPATVEAAVGYVDIQARGTGMGETEEIAEAGGDGVGGES